MVLVRVKGRNPERSDSLPATTLTDDGSSYLPVAADCAAPPRGLLERDPHRYEVLEEHGQGGLGRVLRVYDRELERVVALKELLNGTPVAEERFAREAKLSARLQHPNIVPIYEAGRWPSGKPFYSMKLVEGRSLKDAINQCTSLAERLTLLPHVLSVAEAVAYAHNEGIIHRDLKPANVITGHFGETVVIDWGLAKDLTESSAARAPANSRYRASAGGGLTETGAVMGTVGYMPPEQARGEDVDERADIYALGAILYHVLSGELPIGGRTPQEALRNLLHEAPTPLRAREPLVPTELVAIVERAMAREPSDRYPSAARFAEDLRRFQSGQLVTAHAYSRWQLALRWLNRHRAAATAGVLVLLTIMAATAISFVRISRERDAAILARRLAEESFAVAERARNLLTRRLEAQEALTDDLLNGQITFDEWSERTQQLGDANDEELRALLGDDRADEFIARREDRTRDVAEFLAPLLNEGLERMGIPGIPVPSDSVPEDPLELPPPEQP